MQWAGASPLTAYNVALLLTFPLSAIAAHALVFGMTKRHDAAIVAGLVFGFNPYRVFHLGHLQVLWSFWMPLALLGLHLYLARNDRRWLWLFGVAWLLQALSNGYFLFFFGVLVGLWLVWFCARRDDLGRLAVAGGVWLAASLPLFPFLLKYRDVHAAFGFRRDASEIAVYSADVASLLSASPLIRFWKVDVFHSPEGALFPGLTAMALVALALGLWLWRAPHFVAAARGRSLAFFYGCATVALFALSLGPVPKFMGVPFLPHGPYAALMWLPGVDALRVPARFAMPAVLCLAITAGLAFARLTASFGRGSRATAIAVVATLIVADGWFSDVSFMKLPLLVPPLEALPAQTVAVIELPIGVPAYDLAAMHRSMYHGHPTVNGYSGYFPPHYGALREFDADVSDVMLDELAAWGPILVIIDEQRDAGGRLSAAIAGRAGVVPLGRQLAGQLFLVPARDPPAPIATAPRLAVRSASSNVAGSGSGAMIDGSLLSSWTTGAPQHGGEAVTIDLGGAHPVTGVILSLGQHVFDYPRALAIDTSVDGAEWTTAWSGRTASRVFAAAERSPREVPVSFPLADSTARFLRLRQLGTDPVYNWTIAELAVIGR